MSRYALVAALGLLACSFGVEAQEALFSNENAYNPVPSPSGATVAYVLTGRGRVGGSGGFGTSNMKSFLGVSPTDGHVASVPPMECFLGRWLDDTSISCWRDWHFGVATKDGWRLTGVRNVDLTHGPIPALNEVYLAALKTFVWLEYVKDTTLLQTPNGPLVDIGKHVPFQCLLVPSPDERYLAVTGDGESLLIINLQTKKIVDLGRIHIRPNDTMGYMEPSWDPWFRDSSRLVYSIGKAIYVASPDGSSIEEVGKNVTGYMPVPSPDGNSIAYATFVGHPMGGRPDLTFWGDAALWVIDRGQKQGFRITQPTEETILDLRWLDGATLIFDRLRDQAFPETNTRIWTAKVNPRR